MGEFGQTTQKRHVIKKLHPPKARLAMVDDHGYLQLVGRGRPFRNRKYVTVTGERLDMLLSGKQVLA
jgi:hypothetical protein